MSEDLGQPLEGDGILTPVKCLIGNNAGNISFAPLALYLLGRPSPYLHNGVQCSDNGQGGVSYYFLICPFITNFDMNPDNRGVGGPHSLSTWTACVDGKRRENFCLKRWFAPQDAYRTNLVSHFMRAKWSPVQ